MEARVGCDLFDSHTILFHPVINQTNIHAYCVQPALHFCNTIVSQKTGLSRSMIDSYLEGAIPKLDSIERIADALDMTPGELIGATPPDTLRNRKLDELMDMVDEMRKEIDALRSSHRNVTTIQIEKTEAPLSTAKQELIDAIMQAPDSKVEELLELFKLGLEGAGEGEQSDEDTG